MEKVILAALTRRILAAAIEVHRELGPGLLESTYSACFLAQLKLAGLAVESEVHIPIRYKDLEIAIAYRADIIVESAVLIELKAVSEIDSSHVAQILTYLRHSALPVGLLINFNEPTLMRGVRRYVGRSAFRDRGSPPCLSVPLRRSV